MQLVEQGKLDLDQRRQHLPRLQDSSGLRQAHHPAGRHDPHAGIRGGRPSNLFSDDTTNVQPNGEWLKSWTPKRIYPPGTVPAYSNYATALAGYIVERVSGEPFDAVHRAAHLRSRSAWSTRPSASRCRRRLPPRHVGGLRAGVLGRAQALRDGGAGAPAGALAASGADMAPIHDRPPAERPLWRVQHPSARRRRRLMHDDRRSRIDAARSTACCSASTRPTATATGPSPTGATPSGSTAICTSSSTMVSASSSR